MIINLDKVVSSALHVPTFKNVPLYTRVDNANAGEKATGFETKTPEWVDKSKKLYSSPDNIRRLFITYNQIHVELYCPVQGSSNRSLTRSKPSNGISMIDVVNSVVNGDNEYTVRGSGFKALVSPWVCSNIEEIYFDWTLLLSREFNRMGSFSLLNRFYNELKGSTTIEDGRIFGEIFKQVCLEGNQEIIERFPRLKTICYIERLDELYNMTPKNRGTRSLISMNAAWYTNETVVRSIKDPNCVVALYKVLGIPNLNTKYSLKDGIYLFDREVLEPYFKNMETRINDYKRAQEAKEIDKQKSLLVKKANEAKSSFEITLDEIHEDSGNDAVRIAFVSATKGLPEEELRLILGRMSESGYSKYSQIMSGKDV